jgi:hypothetical protein
LILGFANLFADGFSMAIGNYLSAKSRIAYIEREREREDSNERRRQVTFHSFRRFVKTTISDLGYADYSEYFIGHSGSTYWRKKESEKAELFRKIEPYLTFLNIRQLEIQGADILSKVNELEEVNQSLRERDKSKDDAITMLSDQLLTITERLKELERKQQFK